MYKNFLFLTLILFLNGNTVFSQSTDDYIVIETVGYGKNQNEAVLDALRTALESSYGVFINSNTTIINDEIINDEIKTIGSGNILDYQILDIIALDHDISVKLKSTVSISKMIGLGNTSGQQINFNGNVFSKDLKLQELYEKNELAAIRQFLLQYETYLNNVFDYEISSLYPKFNSQTNKYDIEFQIKVLVNDNSLNNLITSLKFLSMDLNDAIKYHSLNKRVYPLIFSLTEDEEILVLLRSQESYNLLVSSFISAPLVSAIDLEFTDGINTYYFNGLFDRGIDESNFCFSDCGFWDDTSGRGNLYLNFNVLKELEGGDSPMFNVSSGKSYSKLLEYDSYSKSLEPDATERYRSQNYNNRESVKNYDGSLEISTSGFRGKLKKIYSNTYPSKEDKNLFKEFIKIHRGVVIGTTDLSTTWLLNQLSVRKFKSENYFLKLRFTKSYSQSEIQSLKEFSVKKRDEVLEEGGKE